MSKKLRIGWFSFSCCEDSTIVFTEILNDHYHEWKNLIEFKACLALQKREVIQDLDISFVEGAIASTAQEEKLKKIRKNSEKLIAVGACAVVGMPSGQRNNFDEKTVEEIKNILIRFDYAAKVKKLSDVVIVDEVIPGCPMEESVFLRIIEKYLVAFGIKS
jgi:coenzyme F420-reducing hydrogenase gamma subunit